MAIASNTVSTMQNRHILTDYAMCLIMLFTVKELDSSDSKLPVTIHGVVCSGCSLPGCDTTYFHVWAPTLRSDKQSSNSQLKWGAPHPPHFDPTDKGSVFFHDQVSQLRKQQYGLLTFWYIVGKTQVNNITGKHPTMLHPLMKMLHPLMNVRLFLYPILYKFLNIV